MSEGRLEVALAEHLGKSKEEANVWVNAMKVVFPQVLAEEEDNKLTLRTFMGVEKFVNGGNRRKDPNTGQFINDEEGNPTYTDRYWDIRATEGSEFRAVLSSLPLPDVEQPEQPTEE